MACKMREKYDAVGVSQQSIPCSGLQLGDQAQNIESIVWERRKGRRSK